MNDPNNHLLDNPCRCHRVTATSHMCHYAEYTCPREGKAWFVINPNAMLAGMTPKVSGYWTCACDQHWEQFNAGNSHLAEFIEAMLGTAFSQKKETE